MSVPFWQTIIRFEKNKITPWIGLRNSLGVLLPLAIGMILGHPSGGLLAAIGALNVSYSDGIEPYRQRLRRMLAASFLCGFAVFLGAVAGLSVVSLALVTTLAAFATGMMVAVSQTAADVANMALATLIVFAAQGLPVGQAAQSGLLALAGGFIETAFALAFWPVSRYRPERMALAALYAELARLARSGPGRISPSDAPPASAIAIQAHQALASLADDRSVPAERYAALLSQAERIRLSLLVLARLHAGFRKETGSAREVGVIDSAFHAAADGLAAIAERLQNPRTRTHDAEHSFRNGDPLRESESRAGPRTAALIHDLQRQLDALAGQLRSAVEMAFHSTLHGSAQFARREAAQPWSLRLEGAIAAIRANLCLESAAFRHAVRLAACICAGQIWNAATGLRRGYWTPMTIGIILRPDFGATFSRGLLRMAGTLAGLILASAIVHFLAPVAGVEALLIFAFTFLMRAFGSANYGIFATAITALVVFLIAIAGTPPGPVMVARGIHTLTGGVIALLAYWLWPTWERLRTPEVFADMLDAYRLYFQAVRDAYLEPEARRSAQLDRARLAARLARSNLEASLSRMTGEPGARQEEAAIFHRMLAESYRFIHAVMALEAGLATSEPTKPRDAFRPFSNAVDITLHYLAAALRGSAIHPESLPDLREDHHALVAASKPGVERHSLVNTETDRIVNSVNTLAGEVIAYVGRFHKPLWGT
jgi:uncharacterized membrane protein YccC